MRRQEARECGGGLWAALCGVWAALFCVLPSHRFLVLVCYSALAGANQTRSKVQLHHRNMPLGRSDATPHHSYFIFLGAAVIIVLAVLPFACEGPLRRWNKNRRGRLE